MFKTKQTDFKLCLNKVLILRTVAVTNLISDVDGEHVCLNLWKMFRFAKTKKIVMEAKTVVGKKK